MHSRRSTRLRGPRRVSTQTPGGPAQLACGAGGGGLTHHLQNLVGHHRLEQDRREPAGVRLVSTVGAQTDSRHADHLRVSRAGGTDGVSYVQPVPVRQAPIGDHDPGRGAREQIRGGAHAAGHGNAVSDRREHEVVQLTGVEVVVNDKNGRMTQVAGHGADVLVSGELPE